MTVLSNVALLLSAAFLGVFAGAMLTEGCVLVPYWRSLSPDEFLAWYAAHGHLLQSFFGPLTTVTGLLAIAAAALSFWQRHPDRVSTLLAALIMVAVTSTFFLYFQKANASFAAATLPVDMVAPELIRWATWHWCRTALSFAALAASMRSLRPH
jgi:hypothetical protein